jgi:hypothetical protein
LTRKQYKEKLRPFLPLSYESDDEEDEDDDEIIIENGNYVVSEPTIDDKEPHKRRAKLKTFMDVHYRAPTKMFRRLSLDSPTRGRRRRDQSHHSDDTDTQYGTASTNDDNNAMMTASHQSTESMKSSSDGYAIREHAARTRATRMPSEPRGAANIFRAPLRFLPRTADTHQPSVQGQPNAARTASAAHRRRGTTSMSQTLDSVHLPVELSTDNNKLTGLEDLFQNTIQLRDHRRLSERIGDWFTRKPAAPEKTVQKFHQNTNAGSTIAPMDWQQQPPASSGQEGVQWSSEQQQYSMSGGPLRGYMSVGMTPLPIVVRRFLVLVAFMARMADWLKVSVLMEKQ